MDFLWPRITNAYGPPEKSERLLNSVIRKLQAGEVPALTDGTQLYNFVFADDAVRAFRIIAESGISNHSYVVGGQEVKPLREFLIQLRDIVAPNIELGFGMVGTHGTKLERTDMISPELFEVLGFSERVSFEEGIKETAQFITNSTSH